MLSRSASCVSSISLICLSALLPNAPLPKAQQPQPTGVPPVSTRRQNLRQCVMEVALLMRPERCRHVQTFHILYFRESLLENTEEIHARDLLEAVEKASGQPPDVRVEV